MNLMLMFKELVSFMVQRKELPYNHDGLLTIHNQDFRYDPVFMNAHLLGKKTGSWGVTDLYWRLYIACWCADHCKSIPGDFVECGTNQGGLALALMYYVDFPSLDKKFYLLDTFCGLPEHQVTKEERSHGVQPGGYPDCYDEVVNRFRCYPDVVIIKGEVPGTLPRVKSEHVAFLSIDMNCAEPEIAAAEYLWDLLSPGGIMLLDDYGWKRHVSQKEAFDVFAKEKGVRVLSLPTGQGLIVK